MVLNSYPVVYSVGQYQFIIISHLLRYPSGVCTEANSSGALSWEDWEDPPLTELQGIQLSGNKQVGNWQAYKPQCLFLHICISVCSLTRSDK